MIVISFASAVFSSVAVTTVSSFSSSSVPSLFFRKHSIDEKIVGHVDDIPPDGRRITRLLAIKIPDMKSIKFSNPFGDDGDDTDSRTESELPVALQMPDMTFIKFTNPFVDDTDDTESELPSTTTSTDDNPISSSSSATGSDNDNRNVITDPEVLVSKAKEVLASDLGVRDDGSTLLSDDFVWIGGGYNHAGRPLNKEEYLAAGKFFGLRTAFPDLDYRPHDFRMDTNDPNTVRLTVRTVGTMRGPLRLRKETLPPNGKRMSCPPEAISMTFDPATGQLKKLCSGFTMDRLVGNTRGLCGVMGAAALAGAPPSEFDIYPPVTVVTRFLGRPVKQVDDRDNNNNSDRSFLAPYPETVMVQLAKGVIAAENGATDPDLLSNDFTFCGPIVGPIPKDAFVKAFGGFNIKGGLPDLEADYSNFRVDPYDPYRVWVDARGRGTRTGVFAGKEPTGLRYEGPPEAASFTFDDDGFCTRLTAGVVMDPTSGNTGGLGGVFGILYATGSPFPGIVTRPIPELLSRLKTKTLSSVTKIDVDGLAVVTKPKPTSNVVPPVLKPTPPSKPPSKYETTTTNNKPAVFKSPKLPPAAAARTNQESPAQKASAAFGSLFGDSSSNATGDDNNKNNTNAKGKVKATTKKATAAAKAKQHEAKKKPKKVVAPRGVPSLTKWRKTRDGSITGKITGSAAFEDGKQITTSEIKSGEFRSGSVVRTTSGSKYFLV